MVAANASPSMDSRCARRRLASASQAAELFLPSCHLAKMARSISCVGSSAYGAGVGTVSSPMKKTLRSVDSHNTSEVGPPPRGGLLPGPVGPQDVVDAPAHLSSLDVA